MDVVVNKAIKEYEGKRVLDIDEIAFRKGNIYALLGLNGSGKTTLLECIGGITDLSSGSINYEDGRTVGDVRQDISIMTQKPYLFNRTVMDNITCGLKFRKFKDDEIKKRVHSYLHYFDIEELLQSNGKKLSGGESAKVAMLRTAVLETKLVLFDEPTASMDIESTMMAEELIMDMKSPERTVIIITHDLNQAERISDFIIFMDKGKVIEMGERSKVLNNPENKLVKLILNR